MEQYFDRISEDGRLERSLKLSLSIAEPDILRQSRVLDHEREIIKKIAPENLHRQQYLKKLLF